MTHEWVVYIAINPETGATIPFASAMGVERFMSATGTMLCGRGHRSVVPASAVDIEKLCKDSQVYCVSICDSKSVIPTLRFLSLGVIAPSGSLAQNNYEMALSDMHWMQATGVSKAADTDSEWDR